MIPAEVLVPVSGRRGRPAALYEGPAAGSIAGRGSGGMGSAPYMGAMGGGEAGGGMSGMGGGAESAGISGSGGVAQIPLGQVATIRTTSGPMAIKTEGAFPTAWVFVDVAGRDIGSYVADARRMVESMVVLPPGYSFQWSGQYEYMQRAKEKLQLVVPATLVIIFLLPTSTSSGWGRR